jgi:hypothetical protein
MNKEKVTRELGIKIQPSLFLKFQKKCNDEYKTISEVMRELIVEYIKEK